MHCLSKRRKSFSMADFRAKKDSELASTDLILRPRIKNYPMRIKRLLQTVFCLVCLIVVAPQVSRASHYAAGDIQVTFIGRDSLDLRYLVRYYVYKVCERVDPNNPSSGM